ncbi:hypothetical protein [Streptomyces sp. Root1310]|uniref:hypothetical protein n=1 Tax=Streptomyces sp. Root1310 TaxID=1736452 RepID=UPI00070D7355|nr:hypothetical protein [Streptomyces sp. Root1310]KQX65543.1 hypothetical protein ASD48_18285 [Streptomyces sp. Root1310]
MARKGARPARPAAGQDVERLLDELYATPPSDFVARREQLAAEARRDGHGDEARRIHAARRPTLAAWAANLLLRSQPRESERFLELGRALREAYRSLDADGIRELSEQRRSIVSALSRQAAELAQQAGHGLSGAARQDVESTLRAVLTDEEAAERWAAGRLESALTPPAGFPSQDAAAAGLARKPAAGAAPAAPDTRSRAEDELAERRRLRQGQLGRARRSAEAAERRLREMSAGRADADASLRQARERHDRARAHESAAEERLRRARQELRRAEQERQEAEERLRTAARAVDRAERAARDAAQEVARLAEPIT